MLKKNLSVNLGLGNISFHEYLCIFFYTGKMVMIKICGISKLMFELHVHDFSTSRTEHKSKQYALV